MAGDPLEELALERAVGLGEVVYTRLDVSRMAGVPLDVSRRLWRALGFPDAADGDRIFSEADAEMLTVAATLLGPGLIDTDIAVQVTRVLGQSLARVADAQAASFEQGADGDVASMVAAVESFTPTLEAFVLYAWRRHLAAAIRQRVLSASKGGSAAVAVGFADLVGFTAAAQRVSSQELAEMVGRFEALAYDAVAVHGGHVIKMIGDEVMFMNADASAAARTALDIAETCETDAVIPSARVGVAWGQALRREADLFGPTVNLASRLVNMAFPGTVLVSEAMASSVGVDPELRLRTLREQHLRGIGDVRVHVLRRSRLTT